ADAVRDAFQGIFNRVRPGIHGVDAPFVARAVVGHVADAVKHRIAQVDVGRTHVDAGTQAQAAVRMLAVAHFTQPCERFLGRAVAPWGVGARLGEGATRGADLFGCLFV